MNNTPARLTNWAVLPAMIPTGVTNAVLAWGLSRQFGLSHPLGRLPRMFSTEDQALAAFAADHYSVFTLADAKACGLSERQIRTRVSGPWTHLFEGVYRHPGAVETWESSLYAACLAAGDLAGVSHRAAAVFYELPGRRRDSREIVCKRWERAQHADAGLIVHESRHITEADLTEIDGIPIVRPELCVMQLAWWKPYPNYVEAVMHAARRQRLITYDSMQETFNRQRRRGLRGVKATRLALKRWNPADRPTQSEREMFLMQALRAHDLPEPVAQYEVKDRHGLHIATTDFAYPQWKIVIEYDSDQEHLDEFQIAHDERRRNRITATGLHYFVARKHDLRRGGRDLCEQIRQLASQKVG